MIKNIFYWVKKITEVIVISMLIIISLAGCSKTTDSHVVQNENSSNSVTDKPFKATDYYYKSKIKADKKLVWVGNYNIQEKSVISEKLDSKIFDELNRMLVEDYGCDFTVDVVTLGINGPLDYDTYQNKLRDRIKKGSQIDIINTGFGIEGKPDTYSQAIQDGLLISLTDLLHNTQDGSKLYKAFNEKFWEGMKYKGTIYGFRPLAEAASGRRYLVANDKYYKDSVKTGRRITFDDLGDLLKNLMKSNSISKDVLPVYIDSTTLCSMEGYLQARSGYDGIYYKKVDGKWNFVNGAEEAKLLKIWKKIREYRMLNHYSGESPFESFKSGEFCFAICPFYVEEMNGEKANIYDLICNVTELNSMEGCIVSAQNEVTGIASSSKYPKEAMKFLSLLETEKKLSNLLKYGIEGRNYKIENNKLQVMNTGKKTLGSSWLYNEIITYPQGLETENKTQIYKKRNAEATLSPEVMYQIDYGDLGIQIENIGTIFSQYSGLWNGEYEDVDKTVAELQQKLKEAGVKELVKKLNKLLPEQQ